MFQEFAGSEPCCGCLKNPDTFSDSRENRQDAASQHNGERSFGELIFARFPGAAAGREGRGRNGPETAAFAVAWGTCHLWQQMPVGTGSVF
jgi:hypothetical protein